MPDNSRFIFVPGNKWTDDDTAPYLVLPSAWRRFIFQLLTPRELAVYLYICSLTDQHAVAYPIMQQIVEDLGVRSRQTISAAIETLVDRGFLLTRKQTSGILKGRTVYQRPAPHYTLLQLLKPKDGTAPMLDADLYLVKAERTEVTAGNDSAVKAHLKRLLDKLYVAYLHAPEEKRRDVLIATLTQRLEEIIAKSQSKSAKAAKSSAATTEQDISALPEHIREMIAVD